MNVIRISLLQKVQKKDCFKRLLPAIYVITVVMRKRSVVYILIILFACSDTPRINIDWSWKDDLHVWTKAINLWIVHGYHLNRMGKEDASQMKLYKVCGKVLLPQIFTPPEILRRQGDCSNFSPISLQSVSISLMWLFPKCISSIDRKKVSEQSGWKISNKLSK